MITRDSSLLGDVLVLVEIYLILWSKKGKVGCVGVHINIASYENTWKLTASHYTAGVV